MENEKLQGKVGEVLENLESRVKSRGLTIDSLPEPEPPKCNLCNDTEIISVPGTQGVQFCECRFKKRCRRLVRLNVPEQWHGLRLLDLKPWDKIKDVFPIADQEKLIQELHDNALEGHFFIGPSGVGKSRFLYTLYQEALWSKKATFCSKTSDLVSALKDNEFQRLPEERWHEIVTSDDIRRRETPIHIFLDEFDKIPSTDFVYNMIFKLIDTIYEFPSRAKLSVCTNLSPAYFEEIWGKALFRRLTEVCRTHRLWRAK